MLIKYFFTEMFTGSPMAFGGFLPFEVRRYRKWNMETMDEAILAVTERGCSISKAAIHYDIPVITLWRYLKRRNAAKNPNA